MCTLTRDKNWPNIIKDETRLYRYCKRTALPVDQKEVPGSIFQDGELSCDIASKVEDLKAVPFVKEYDYLVVEIIVKSEVRNPTNPKNGDSIEIAWHQTIIEDSIDGNPAHALIIGKKKAAVTQHIVNNSRFIEP